MSMPKLKRINIQSDQELENWLVQNPGYKESIMVVTHADASHRKHVSRERIGELLEKHGWKGASRYTIGSDLLGHVISRVDN